MPKIVIERPRLNIVDLNRKIISSRRASATYRNNFNNVIQNPIPIDQFRRPSDITSVSFESETSADPTTTSTRIVGETQTALADAAGIGSELKHMALAAARGDHESIDRAAVFKGQSDEVARTNKLLYPGMAPLIENAQRSLETSSKWGLPEKSSSLLSTNGLIKAISLLFLASPTLAYCSTGAVAAGIGASILPVALAGVAAYLIFHACTCEWTQAQIKDPNTIMAKIVGVGKRFLPLVALGAVAYGACAVAGVSGDLIGSLFSAFWQWPAGIAAAIGTFAVMKSHRDADRAILSQMASIFPLREDQAW